MNPAKLTLTLWLLMLALSSPANAGLESEVQALAGTMNWPLPPQQADIDRREGGQITVAPLFSSEQGSWPFEPFTHNGLFTVIANYQQQHPRGLHLSTGHLSLGELHRQLDDPRILRRHKDGYLLSYPLVIDSDGHLEIADSTLYLDIFAGAAIINRGTLSVTDARVTVWQGQRPRADIANYRPFITSWAGSQTWLDHATLERLGYNAHLSRGLTLARSQAQSDTTPDAQIVIRDSVLESLTTGLEVREGQAWIARSQFRDSHHYGIDARNSMVQLQDSEVRNTRLNSAIRLQQRAHLQLTDTLLVGAGKSALESPGFNGQVLLNRAVLSASGSHGLALTANSPSELLITDSIIAGNTLSGAQLAGPVRAVLARNRLQNNQRAALRVDAPTGEAEVELLLWRNQLGRSEQAVIDAAPLARLAMAENHIELAAIEYDWLAGTLAPLQSVLAQRLFRAGCGVELRADEAGLPVLLPSGEADGRCH